ncbi:MAG: thioredoxin-disulfide reductase [Planctomycetota bacterium]|nr:thioredoxin-disulfide reductase [Planctomycetota bacterium]
MSTVHEVIIIGSGPAGYTAAIYAARANLSPIVFEGEPSMESPDLLPGGQLMLTTEVENYPGFPDGVTGPDLMASFRAQAERFGTRIEMMNVVEVDLEATPKRLKTSDGNWHEAHAVIICTGASARWLGLESETAMRNRGVSACATCDGAFFKDKVVAVVGGGDTACEEATFLTRFASKVYLIHRRDQLRASKIMAERALGHEKIEPIWNSVVSEVVANETQFGPRVAGLKLEDTVTGEASEVEVGGMFVAIGHVPNTAFLNGALETDELGYLVVGPGGSTKIEGVWAAGDVADHVYRQAITAAGMGCQSAIAAERWLESRS